MPRVSVIIPVFNAARTVAQAIDSVRVQTFTDFEIIAADDGSTDGGIEIIGRYGGAVKLLQQENRGPSAARNLAIANSSGEYLAFLDGDDWWKPEFLAKMIAALQRDPQAVMAYCDLQLVDSLGRPFPTALRMSDGHAPTVKEMLDRLWPIVPSGVLMRRAALDAVGGYPEALRAFEDVYLWLLLRENGPFVYVPESLAVWRFAHFPAPLKPPGGQEAPGRIFRQMVMARYGVDPIRHVSSRERAPRSTLGYIGLDALAHGDRATARQAFVRAIALDPYRIRNYLRLLRTVLPAAMARALSGKAGRAA
ncbi:MAG TPA: glycosyltransferase family A protein [Candidatus Binataceae bacterium]|nr:glycosyltransferase family A protein [Candidatus Binataceae bacterium]